MSSLGIKRVTIHKLNLKTGEKTEHKLNDEEIRDWLSQHGYKNQKDKKEQET